MLNKIFNVYYTIKHVHKSTNKSIHIYTIIYVYTQCRLYQAKHGMSRLLKVTENGYYILVHTLKSTHKPLHVHTPSYHTYNNQYYIPYIHQHDSDITHKLAHNINIPTYLYVVNPIYSSYKPMRVEYLYYLAFKYTIYYPLLSPKQNVELIHIFLHLLKPDSLLSIPSHYPGCNPECTKMICING